MTCKLTTRNLRNNFLYKDELKDISGRENWFSKGEIVNESSSTVLSMQEDVDYERESFLYKVDIEADEKKWSQNLDACAPFRLHISFGHFCLSQTR